MCPRKIRLSAENIGVLQRQASSNKVARATQGEENSDTLKDCKTCSCKVLLFAKNVHLSTLLWQAANNPST